jgi:hypothetical protein
MIGILTRERKRECHHPSASAEITPQSLMLACDLHESLLGLWQRHRDFSPQLIAHLKDSRALPRCMFLLGENSDDLRWRFIGLRSLAVASLGTRWAELRLGEPHDEGDPCGPDFATSIGAQYRAAAESGEPLLNHVVAFDITAQPVIYNHLLLPWRAADGRSALLVATDR